MESIYLGKRGDNMSGLLMDGSMIIYLLGLAATWGALMWRISALEKKMDKHNCLMERMAVAENNIKAAEHRLDHIEGAE